MVENEQFCLEQKMAAYETILAHCAAVLFCLCSVWAEFPNILQIRKQGAEARNMKFFLFPPADVAVL